MRYTQNEFAALSEQKALADIIQSLTNPLSDTLEAARADVQGDFTKNLYPSKRRQALVNSLINARATKLWQSQVCEWSLSDNSGYLHLFHNDTGARVVLRRVDPVTNGLPKSNHSKVGEAYYLQSRCKSAGTLMRKQPTLFDNDEDAFIPDLSETKLIAAWDGVWDDIETPLIISVYRPTDVASYGVANKYDFKMELSRIPDFYKNLRFTPMTETEPLPNLLVQEDAMENIESNLSQKGESDEE